MRYVALIFVEYMRNAKRIWIEKLNQNTICETVITTTKTTKCK
jgi:hypothetical protein